ncbi:hypothetical protein E8Q33_00045 [Methylophaga sp. SB9B]|uniref:hypothetical protein n=1 Tax=Methylophaga sp. SB9B TaxID=2570356 RepID=UPI0010A7674F|nr:hypothetical protein [Methylophaga sp. SB9B]THK43077.1 hypothetical protein E8Q33_00045 [Methylophaga sp. SB9B]
MKKTMLFFAALLLSFNASAASLTLVGDAGNKGTVGISSGEVVTASTSPLASGAFVSDAYTVTSDIAAIATLSLTFNPLAPTTAVSIFDGMDIVGLSITKIGSLGILEYTWLLEAATEYVINVFIGKALSGSNYDLRLTAAGISEVPLPAALWLFAPALLGFLSFRRKANKLSLA